MADEMQPIYTSEPARVPAVGDGGEFQTFKKPSVYVPYVQYDSIESLSVYGSMEGVSSIYVNSHQYVLPIPKPLTLGDVWHSKVKSSYDKRIVLDGTEHWFISKGVFFYKSAVTDNALTMAACDRYKFHITDNGVSGVTTDKTFAFNIDTPERIMIRDDDYTSIEEFKAYLTDNPLTVYYQSTAYDGTNGLTVSIADYRGEIYANNFVDVFTDDGELWVDGGDFVEVAVNNIVLNGKTNDERAGEYGTPQVHTFP